MPKSNRQELDYDFVEEDDVDVEETEVKATGPKKPRALAVSTNTEKKVETAVDSKDPFEIYWHDKEIVKQNVVRVLQNYPPVLKLLSFKHEENILLSEVLADRLKKMDDKTPVETIYKLLKVVSEHLPPENPKGTFSNMLAMLCDKIVNGHKGNDPHPELAELDQTEIDAEAYSNEQVEEKDDSKKSETKADAKKNVAKDPYVGYWTKESDKENIVRVLSTYPPILGGLFSFKHSDNVKLARVLASRIQKMSDETSLEKIYKTIKVVNHYFPPENPKGTYSVMMDWLLKKLDKIMASPSEEAEAEVGSIPSPRSR